MSERAILLVLGLGACAAAARNGLAFQALIAPVGGERFSRNGLALQATTLADLPGPEQQSLDAAMREAQYAVWKADGTPARGPVQAGEVLTAANPSQKYSATFSEDGARVEPTGDERWSLGLRLAAFGSEGDARPVGGAVRSAEGRRVEYGRDDIVEWYENTDEGLEHGFTIAGPPQAGERLEIVLDVDSELEARASADGSRVDLYSSPGVRRLSYCKLAVMDATGRDLPARMTAGDRGLSILVDVRGAAYPVIVDPLLTRETKLTALDGAESDFFGRSVSVSGDTAVVGANGDDDSGSGSGAAYVFVRSGGTWTQQQKLTASDGAAGDYFGGRVSVSGETAVVGASGADVGRGAAYVFVRSGGTWTEEQKLTASDGAANDEFGVSVSVSGDTAVVGARYADIGGNAAQGAAYVFVRSGGTWTEEQKLIASDGAASDYFGRSVSVSGDTAVVGANLADIGGNGDQGAAYVFVRSGGTWTEEQKLIASDGEADDDFGISVSVSGDTAAVGAYYADVGGNANQGAAYVFVRSGGTWTEEQKLTASDGAGWAYFGISVSVSGDTAIVGAYRADVDVNAAQGAAYVFDHSFKHSASDGALGDRLGYSVSVSGDTAVVGAYRADVGVNTDQGAAYVFVRSGGIWAEEQKLAASDGADSDWFGWSVSLSGDTVVVGAHYADIGGNGNQGAAYVFVRSGGTWTQEDKLIASDGAADEEFGVSVSVSGDTAVVGAYYADVGGNSAQGAAYVFVRSGGTWTEEDKLIASDGAGADWFGRSVSVSGDTAVAGAYAANVVGNVDQGAAYVFVRSGGTWEQEQKLTASDGAAFDSFGVSISVSGDTAAVGAYYADVGGNDNQGAAYVFVRSGGTWTEEDKLIASDGAVDDRFGISVSVSGDRAVVGAPLANVGGNSWQGAAYVFLRSGGTWAQEDKLLASDGAADDQFGVSVSVSGHTAVVGARYADVDGNSWQGAVYFFQLVNRPPVANDDICNVDEDNTLNVAAPGVLANDTDAELAPLTAILVSDVSDGTLTLNADGSFSYAPALNFNGSDSFTYKANDGTVDSDAATVTISVDPVNDAPGFTKGSDETVLEDCGAQTVPGWATGISAGPPDESGQALSFIVTNDNNSLFAVQPAVAVDGTLAYTPADEANGSATVSVQLQDDGGMANGGSDTSTLQTFTITITAVNDAPSFTKGSDETVLEDCGAQTVPGWATGISAGPPDESGQALSFIVTNDNNSLFAVQPAVAGDGTLAYTPADDANGSATVTVQLQDDGGTINGGVDTSAAQAFTITVSPANDPPVANDDAYGVNEDETLTVVAAMGVLANDTDVDSATLTAIPVSDVSNGTLALNADGSFTYTPDLDFHGADSFTYKANDGAVDSNVATVDVTVNPENDPPVANDDSDITDVDTPVIIDVVANDTDVELDTLTISSSTQGTNGTVTDSGGGTLTYAPDSGFSGIDTFTYTIDDGNGGSDTATVTVSVTTSGAFTPVSDFAATARSECRIDLGWVNPDEPTLAGVALFRKEGAAPAFTPVDGQSYVAGTPYGDALCVCDGTDSAFSDTGLSPNTQYFYVVHAYDDTMAYSVGAGADATTMAVTAPAVLSASPADGAEDALLKSCVQVTFSEPMGEAPTEGAFSVDGGVTGTFTWSDAVLTFTPDAMLAEGTTYTVTIGAGAEDEYGQAISPYQFSFTTRTQSGGMFGGGGCAPGAEVPEGLAWLLSAVVLVRALRRPIAPGRSASVR